MNGYLQFNPSGSTHGKFVQQALGQLVQGKRALADILATKNQMITATGGDGSQDADYAIWATAIGCVARADGATANQVARGISDELESCNSKVNSDASVDHVATAIEQAASKLRI